VFRYWRLDELLPMLYLIPEMAELLVSWKITMPILRRVGIPTVRGAYGGYTHP
jgi:hypothetical protein